MVRSKRMKVVQNYAKDCTSKAAKVASSSRRVLDEHSQRLDQLSNYREEYWRNISTSTSVTQLNAVRLQDYRLFLSRLDQAIEQQRQLVHQAEAEYQNDSKMLDKTRIREKSIDTVVEKLEKKESVHRNKIEQKQMDEMGQRIKIRIFEQV